MKKALALSVAAVALFIGCSKQPQLQNEEAASSSTTSTQKVAPMPESVSTENATITQESINSGENLSNDTQTFAKRVSSIVVYFDFDKYNIRKDQWPKVEKLAELIKSNPNNYTIRIEGNCDEWGTEEYNYALGLKRANSVKNALIKLGVDPSKLTVISYGELNPVCREHNRRCWRLNRRDNFTYLP